MKITKIMIIMVSFSSLLYAMEDYEGVKGNGCTLDDLITSSNFKAPEALIIYECANCVGSDRWIKEHKREYVQWVKGFNERKGFSINFPLADLAIFKCVEMMTLENCFMQRVQFNTDMTLPRLEILSLARNYLKKIELTKILTMAPQLEQLDLSHNPIEEIILEPEYKHEGLLTINLEITDYAKQPQSDEFIDKVFNSVDGKKLLIKW